MLVYFFIYFAFIIDCAEYVTKKIKEEISFYDKCKPYEVLKSGIFGNGTGIEGEYIIPIKIDIHNEYGDYNDEFEWDLLNQQSE